MSFLCYVCGRGLFIKEMKIASLSKQLTETVSANDVK